MLVYPEINPIAISFGPFQIAWYGLMYLFGFLAAYWLAVKRTKKDWSPLANSQIEDLIFYSAVGVILGGRLGYMFFYGKALNERTRYETFSYSGSHFFCT